MSPLNLISKLFNCTTSRTQAAAKSWPRHCLIDRKSPWLLTRPMVCSTRTLKWFSIWWWGASGVSSSKRNSTKNVSGRVALPEEGGGRALQVRLRQRGEQLQQQREAAHRGVQRVQRWGHEMMCWAVQWKSSRYTAAVGT